MAHYDFDISSFNFRKITRSARNIVLTVLKYAIASVSLAIVYYIVFALLVSDDTEKELHRENRMYARLYPSMLAQQQLVGDAIEGLEAKDGRIYTEIFNASAPSIDPIAISESGRDDTLGVKETVLLTQEKSEQLLSRAEKVEQNFRRMYDLANVKGYRMPPMRLPLDNFTYAQVGASLGSKINPFFKVPSQHMGVDLVASPGDPVFAAMDGEVADVITSRKGHGNEVVINHPGGYQTRYSHLSEISVSRGQKVTTGRKVGEVGTSGNSFVPHLHYEVLLEGVNQDPVNYFFASVTPHDYANMLYMAERTGQAMD